MRRFIIYQLIWKLGNYLVRNPQARNAVLRGLWSLLMLGTIMMVSWGIVGAVIVIATLASEWKTSISDNTVILIGVGLAILAGLVLIAIAVRLVWRRWRNQPDNTILESIEITPSATLPSTDNPNNWVVDQADDDLLNEIVIEEKKG